MKARELTVQLINVTAKVRHRSEEARNFSVKARKVTAKARNI